ncbi:hypothetical protein NDU88_004726, partial [Pleurodeles waltl]
TFLHLQYKLQAVYLPKVKNLHYKVQRIAIGSMKHLQPKVQRITIVKVQTVIMELHILLW